MQSQMLLLTKKDIQRYSKNQSNAINQIKKDQNTPNLPSIIIIKKVLKNRQAKLRRLLERKLKLIFQTTRMKIWTRMNSNLEMTRASTWLGWTTTLLTKEEAGQLPKTPHFSWNCFQTTRITMSRTQTIWFCLMWTCHQEQQIPVISWIRTLSISPWTRGCLGALQPGLLRLAISKGASLLCKAELTKQWNPPTITIGPKW